MQYCCNGTAFLRVLGHCIVTSILSLHFTKNTTNLVESVYSMYCIQSIHSTYTIYASVLTSVLRYNYWMLLKESILFLYVGSTLFIRLPIYPTLCYRSLATKTCLTAHSFRRRRQRRWRPEPELVYFQEIVSNLTRYLYFKISKPSILYQRGAKDRLS